MNREAADRWCERGILGLVLAIVVYGPLATGAVRAPDFLVLQSLTIGVMVLWAVRLWVSPRPQLLWPPVCWAVLAFTAYAVGRYLTCDLEYTARLEMIRVLVYAVLFLAVLNNLYRQESLQWIALTLVVLAMLISGYAVFQFVAHSDKVWTFTKPYPHRGSGTYISPNHCAGFLEMILPLALAWTLVSRARPVLKVVTGYATFAILAGIAVTVSRGGWVAAGMMLLVFFGILLTRPGYRIPSAVMLVIMLGAGIWFVPRTRFFGERIGELTAPRAQNDSSRFELWKPAVQLWRENVWWGIGPDHFNYRFRAFRPESIQLEPDRVHNDYLNTLVDWGIAGVVLVAAAWTLFWSGVFTLWPSVCGPPSDLGSRHSNRFALVLGGSMGLLAILIHSFVDFNMHIPANAIIAVTLMAMMSSCLRFASDQYWVKAGRPLRSAVALILLAGAIYLGRQGCLRGQAYAWSEAAARAPNFSPEQIAALEKAHAAEPHDFETTYALGEAYRVESWEGGADYAELAAKAMDWFALTQKLNPYHGYSYMRYGMCLDWLGRSAEAYPYFDRAVRLDPNGSFTMAHMGWHYVQTEDYAAATAWFERSRRLQPGANPIAESYLQIIRRKLVEATRRLRHRPPHWKI